MKKRLSAEETAEAFSDMIDKGTRTLKPKIEKGKRWFKRIGAVFFLLIGVPLMLSGIKWFGFLMLAVAAYLIAGGFFDHKIEKIAGGLLFVCGGLFFAGYGYTAYRQGLASENWSKANGTVIKSEIVKRTRTTGTGTNRRKVVEHIPQVAYAYKVNGHSYQSSRITFGAINKLNAGKTVQRYAKGKNIEVFYDPQKPDEAVLMPGADSTLSIVSIGIGSVIMITGLMATFKDFKRTQALSRA
jgi:hypothetical protein